MQSPHIAVIDSGIGGLSILAEIEAKLPYLSISYFMDNLYLPYGTLDQPVLLERLAAIVEFMLQNNPPDIFVIACNTASTQSLDFLRQRYGQTFVGVVPAIKPAAGHTSCGRIGLLATPATVNGSYLGQLISDFATDCCVHSVGSCELVHLAEQRFWNGDAVNDDSEAIAYILSPLKDIDTLVLGCTHFPLIKHQIRAALPDHVTLLDSGEAIARRVAFLLADTIPVSDWASNKHLYATEDLTLNKRQKLSGMGFSNIDHIELNVTQTPALLSH